ncbi:MAG: Acetylpolyamine aminohydrolase [Pseudomonadota bacterium]|jgi:acetoin utilization deacetylase AcuC-like enzyme
MKIFSNTHHHLHRGQQEMFRGRLVDCHEVPQRLDHVLAELARRPVGQLLKPPQHLNVDAALESVHTSSYLAFLATAWQEWVKLNPDNANRDALPSVWPLPGHHAFRMDKPPLNFAARLGQYAFDAGTPLMAGTWQAAREGAACAVAAAHALMAGESATVALTRPPGHHAGPAYMGGYCFLNNAAVAAQQLIEQGLQRVAVLDIDYHHGNGTQAIFDTRADVYTLSIHGDPQTEYPFFLGHADERGSDEGQGFNLNLPLPRGTEFEVWFAAMQKALQVISDYGPQALVVPLGLDTYEGDPISGFKLKSAHYLKIGQAIASLRLPTVFTLEGGYAVADFGINTVNVLEGFQTF